ncbi:hypothetical protein C8J57DRAFT_1223581 [Mycena rebaudengoi]|nr:hypothetical protein C8J57DRAFT_1223581 [Mycena rebaudengoi]
MSQDSSGSIMVPMSHSEATVLPLELQQRIFELTGQLYPQMIPTLMRLCRYALHWMEPALYRIMPFNPTPHDMANIILQLVERKPAGFFERAVRRVYVFNLSRTFMGGKPDEPSPDKEIERLLRVCTGADTSLLRLLAKYLRSNFLILEGRSMDQARGRPDWRQLQALAVIYKIKKDVQMDDILLYEMRVALMTQNGGDELDWEGTDTFVKQKELESATQWLESSSVLKRNVAISLNFTSNGTRWVLCGYHWRDFNIGLFVLMNHEAGLEKVLVLMAVVRHAIVTSDTLCRNSFVPRETGQWNRKPGIREPSSTLHERIMMIEEER